MASRCLFQVLKFPYVGKKVAAAEIALPTPFGIRFFLLLFHPSRRGD